MTDAKVVSTSSSLRILESCSMTGKYPATTLYIFFRISFSFSLYSYSKLIKSLQNDVKLSVVKVILLCFAVRNLY
jgi:hypothetical protein